MKLELKKIARGFSQSAFAFDAYDVNGYRFHTHEYTQRRANRKTINSGVLCEGSDKVHYYGRVEGIYELDYGFGKGLNPVVFKCHWFDPHRVKRKPEIGWVEVERSSVYAGKDVYILATQAFQVFYLSYPCKNPKKRLQGWDVVITVPTHNRPAKPNEDDYRRLDPSTYEGEFFQEEGLPGNFTINLPIDDDMVIDDEEGEAGEEDNVCDEVEEVENEQDLTLLDRFHAGLDTDESTGPPPGYVDPYWGEHDSDDETRGPSVVHNDLDTGF